MGGNKKGRKKHPKSDFLTRFREGLRKIKNLEKINLELYQHLQRATPATPITQEEIRVACEQVRGVVDTEGRPFIALMIARIQTVIGCIYSTDTLAWFSHFLADHYEEYIGAESLQNTVFPYIKARFAELQALEWNAQEQKALTTPTQEAANTVELTELPLSPTPSAAQEEKAKDALRSARADSNISRLFEGSLDHFLQETEKAEPSFRSGSPSRRSSSVHFLEDTPPSSPGSYNIAKTITPPTTEETANHHRNESEITCSSVALIGSSSEKEHSPSSL